MLGGSTFVDAVCYTCPKTARDNNCRHSDVKSMLYYFSWCVLELNTVCFFSDISVTDAFISN